MKQISRLLVLTKAIILILSLFLCICASLTGCTYLKDNGSIPDHSSGEGVEESILSGAEINDINAEIAQKAISPDKLELTSAIESGHLYFSVDRARIVTNLKTEEIDLNAIYKSDAFVFLNGEDITFDEYYDEESGALADGVYLLLLDLTVTNDGAISTMYEAPDVFRADNLLWLVNAETSFYTTATKGKTYVGTSGIDYFSGFGRCQEGVWAFRVDDGESITIQIGFFIGHNGADFNDLYGSQQSQGVYNKDFTFISLNVEQ